MADGRERVRILSAMAGVTGFLDPSKKCVFGETPARLGRTHGSLQADEHFMSAVYSIFVWPCLSYNIL